MRRVLITGGAGFIGSHLADELVPRGWRVRALDSLTPQVHGIQRRRPDYLRAEVELAPGDVRDPDALRAALDGVDAVVHLAALVGVGQSMYLPGEYTDVNCHGTAEVLEAAVERKVAKLLVASSMSVYGEGAYVGPGGEPRPFVRRSADDLARRSWEASEAGEPLLPVPTGEEKAAAPASVYALSKHYQERICLEVGAAYGIPTVALRFFNAYGPRQALSNPYTGVLAIFASRLLNGEPPLVYEDGRQRRDFVSVHDVARACRMALEQDGADGEVINVGSGEPRTVLEVATTLARVTGREEIRPLVLGKYRVGDVRHCFADIDKARRLLGWEPEVEFERGIEELAAWLAGQEAGADQVTRASEELARRGLAL